MTEIVLQLSETLLARARSLAGGTEHLQDFLIQAIEREVALHQQPNAKHAFWENLRQLRTEMNEANIEIDPDEIWGDVRDKSVGREIHL